MFGIQTPLDVFGQATGVTSVRNNAAANAATKNANAGNDQLYGDWQNQTNQQLQRNQQIADTNYQQNANNVYQQQQNAAGMLYNQASGQAPSASQLQQQAGLANANNQVQSAALANQGGMTPGATQRNLLQAQAAQNAGIVAQGMATRAAEQAQQQQQYAAVLAAMQQQQQQAGLINYGQQANALNYQTQASQNALQFGMNRNQTNLGNTVGAINQAAQANAAQAQAALNTATSIAKGVA